MVEMVSVAYGRSGASKAVNALGQRPMQARAYAARGAQFLLLKAPPAAGKSRALMFIALDKMNHQGLKKTIVCVPETSIGGSFRSNELTAHGFDADWIVEGRWNLCLSGAEDGSTAQKVKTFCDFLESEAPVLVCTHATFRFGFDAVEKARGVEAFDDVFLAIPSRRHNRSNSEPGRKSSRTGSSAPITSRSATIFPTTASTSASCRLGRAGSCCCCSILLSTMRMIDR
jgi:hypothetical protein